MIIMNYNLVIVVLFVVTLKRTTQFDIDDQIIEQKYVNGGQSVLLVCDLPTNMPDGHVLFIKSDSKVISVGTDIRENGDEQRYEINQQYAWEWSLKINSLSEDDSGVYYCKVGNTIIKQYNVVVRVPPRIKDDQNELIDSSPSRKHVLYKEGDTIKLNCLATGTPRPNITWYLIDSNQSQLVKLDAYTNQNQLILSNITRFTHRNYQCRASNGIPPNDNRNFTFQIHLAPEIQIQSKFDNKQNEMQLNCTINAYPLTNKYFWRKDGNYINEDMKYNIKNMFINDYTIVSVLTIKYYNDNDMGLYECTGENDLRVSKIVYNLKDNQDKLSQLINSNSDNNNNIPIISIKNIEQRNKQQQQQQSNLIRFDSDDYLYDDKINNKKQQQQQLKLIKTNSNKLNKQHKQTTSTRTTVSYLINNDYNSGDYGDYQDQINSNYILPAIVTPRKHSKSNSSKTYIGDYIRLNSLKTNYVNNNSSSFKRHLFNWSYILFISIVFVLIT